MKVVAITGPREAAIVERPEPGIADNYVLVKILAAPMCTEWQAFRDGKTGDVLGHEAAGEVVEATQDGRWRKGDRVVVMPQDGCGKCSICIGGDHVRCQSPRDPLIVCSSETGRATYAELCIQQDWLLLGVPDDITIEHSSLACCGLGPAFGAMQRMAVTSDDTVLISGLGPVGLGAVVCAAMRGARVIGIECNRYRVTLAKELGAEAVIDPLDPEALSQIRSLTGGNGAHKSIEASSQEAAPALLLQATRIGGQMTSIGWGGPVDMRDIVRRGVCVFGQWHWNHARDADAMFDTIRRAGSLLDRLITHRLPMTRVEDAWELQIAGQCGKVLLLP